VGFEAWLDGVTEQRFQALLNCFQALPGVDVGPAHAGRKLEACERSARLVDPAVAPVAVPTNS
jgi:hypothetical protein